MNRTLETIRKKLDHFSLEQKPTEWLDTGIPDLNLVLGHKDKGLAYGKVIEISGWPSMGKTAIMMALAALAQRDGAQVIWGDVENSFDVGWALQRGILACPDCKGESCKTCGGAGYDTDKLILVQPYVGTFAEVDQKGKKREETRLSNAQELCSEMEMCLKAQSKFKKRILVLDSIPALLTAGEANAGLEGGGFRSNMDLPMFLSRLLRRWVGIAQVTNTMLVMINQLRTNPMQKFGSPDYTPGGNAPLFFSHVRVRVVRTKGGKMTEMGRTVGIQGVMRALKNKCGGEEGATVGYRLWYKSALEFIPAKDLKKEGAESE